MSPEQIKKTDMFHKALQERHEFQLEAGLGRLCSLWDVQLVWLPFQRVNTMATIANLAKHLSDE